MSEENEQQDPMMNAGAAGAAPPLAAMIPPDLTAAFFTGNQRAIGEALANNKELLSGFLRQMPRRALREVANGLGDVLGAPDADETDAIGHEDTPRRRRAQPREDVIDASFADDADDADVVRDDAVAEEVDEDDEGTGGDMIELLNQLGRGIGNLLAELPGAELGITFVPGGRKVRVAYFYPATAESELEELSVKTGHVARFGDALEGAYSEAESMVNSEMDGDEDEDDLDADGESLDFYEDEPAPAQRRAPRAGQPQARRR